MIPLSEEALKLLGYDDHEIDEALMAHRFLGIGSHLLGCLLKAVFMSKLS